MSETSGEKNDPKNPEILEPTNTTEQEVSGEDSTEGEEVVKLKEELDNLHDKYLRQLAEMDNLRKRHEKERKDLLNFGLEKFLNDILPVLDSLDRALPEASVESKATTKEDATEDVGVIEGMQLVKKQLIETVTKAGLEKIQAAGADFNPNLHQAIQRVDSESLNAGEEKVKQVFVDGYLLNGRLLRAAVVSVEVGSKEEK